LRRKILLITVFVLLLVITLGPVMSLPVSAEVDADKAEVETADVQPTATIFSDGFEGSWLWSRGDFDSTGGTDTWYRTNQKDYSGSYSAWCAEYGSQSVPATIFTEDFEYASWPSTWHRGDLNSNSGIDTWGLYGAGYSSAKSAWCAGSSDHPYGSNMYDNNMAAYMYRDVDLSRYSSVTISYRYWVSTQANHDYLYVYYRIGSSQYAKAGLTGTLGGWHYASTTIPTTATGVGFYFYSDSSTVSTGAWVDTVTLTGTPAANNAIHKYDDNMEAYMYRTVDLSGYTGVTLSYMVWLDSALNDWFMVKYRRGTTWYQTGSSYAGAWDSWYSRTVSIPSDANAVGFFFESDGATIDEGAYVDNVVLTGTPTKEDTVLDFWFTPNPVQTGATCTLSGTLKTTGGAAVYPASVIVEYSTDGGATWHYAFTPSTTPAGTFAATFTAPAPGTYLVRGRYLGSASYNPSSHTETLTITPAAWGDYHFQISPFIDKIHIKISGSVVYGIHEIPGVYSETPLLGYIEGSTFYILVDYPDGVYSKESMLLVGSTSTLSGSFYQTTDGTSWSGPTSFSLVSTSSASASSATESALASSVEPESWPPTYHFRLSPWVDIVRLGVDGSVIHGTDESASYPYHDQPVLGYVSGSFFALGIDWTKDDSGNEIYYELSLIRASTSTMSGYAYRTTDGKSFASGPAISFVSVSP